MAIRTSLRLSATLLLAGQFLYIVVSQFHEGFSQTHTILILVAWVVSVPWMIWLALDARRMPDSVAARLHDRGVRAPADVTITATLHPLLTNSR